MPGVVVPGKKIPLITVVAGKGPVHVPFRAGEPNNRVTIEKGASVEQTVILLEIPGLELAVTNT